MGKQTSPLNEAIGNDKRNAFLVHLADTDTSQPGWADEAVKRALYVSNRHFFLKELIKRGIKCATKGEDYFRVSCLMDPSGESSRLLLKAGYCPDISMLPILKSVVLGGNLAQSPALVAALPVSVRRDSLAQLCAMAALGSLSDEDASRLGKAWKGAPPADFITFFVTSFADHIRRNQGEVAEFLSRLAWLDVSQLKEDQLGSPLGRCLLAKAQQVSLDAEAPQVPRLPSRSPRI